MSKVKIITYIFLITLLSFLAISFIEAYHVNKVLRSFNHASIRVAGQLGNWSDRFPSLDENADFRLSITNSSCINTWSHTLYFCIPLFAEMDREMMRNSTMFCLQNGKHAIYISTGGRTIIDNIIAIPFSETVYHPVKIQESQINRNPKACSYLIQGQGFTLSINNQIIPFNSKKFELATSTNFQVASISEGITNYYKGYAVQQWITNTFPNLSTVSTED